MYPSHDISETQHSITLCVITPQLSIDLYTLPAEQLHAMHLCFNLKMVATDGYALFLIYYSVSKHMLKPWLAAG